eukprot:226875-Amphidinium_carterae.1
MSCSLRMDSIVLPQHCQAHKADGGSLLGLAVDLLLFRRLEPRLQRLVILGHVSCEERAKYNRIEIDEEDAARQLSQMLVTHLQSTATACVSACRSVTEDSPHQAPDKRTSTCLDVGTPGDASLPAVAKIPRPEGQRHFAPVCLSAQTDSPAVRVAKRWFSSFLCGPLSSTIQLTNGLNTCDSVSSRGVLLLGL